MQGNISLLVTLLVSIFNRRFDKPVITQNIRRGFTSNWSEYYKINNENIHNQFDNLNLKSKSEKFGNILLYINQKSKPNLVMSVARIGMTHIDIITLPSFGQMPTY